MILSCLLGLLDTLSLLCVAVDKDETNSWASFRFANCLMRHRFFFENSTAAPRVSNVCISKLDGAPPVGMQT